METKFDIGDKVFVTGTVNKIAHYSLSDVVVYKIEFAEYGIYLWFTEDDLVLKQRGEKNGN